MWSLWHFSLCSFGKWVPVEIALDGRNAVGRQRFMTFTLSEAAAKEKTELTPTVRHADA